MGRQGAEQGLGDVEEFALFSTSVSVQKMNGREVVVEYG